MYIRSNVKGTAIVVFSLCLLSAFLSMASMSNLVSAQSGPSSTPCQPTNQSVAPTFMPFIVTPGKVQNTPVKSSAINPCPTQPILTRATGTPIPQPTKQTNPLKNNTASLSAQGAAGPSDILVTLSWTTVQDMDLYVTDPHGNTIYYGNKAADGGQLDVDANAACLNNVTNSPKENISWPIGSGIPGTYTVSVGFYDSCHLSNPNYSVSAIILQNGSPQTINFSSLPAAPSGTWQRTMAFVGTFVFLGNTASCTITTSQPPNASQLTPMTQMMKVVDSSGIYMRYAPTINAKAIRDANGRLFIPWNTSGISVFARITFATPTVPATSNQTPQQIWYKVQFNNNIGWIMVAYGSKSYLNGANPDPCATQYATAPDTLTFPYDRQAAAVYAIEQSYQNNIVSDPGNGRVSSQLLTPIPDVLFANFDYHSQVTRVTLGTGSAVFVSEGIWMGGLPMTRDIYPQSAGSDLDGNWDCSLDPGRGNTNQSGWRYCPDGGNNGTGAVYATIVWRLHSALASFFTHVSPPFGQQVQNAVLNLMGTRAGKVGVVDKATIFHTSLSNNVNDLKKGIVASQFANTIQTNLADVKQGDYLWLDSGLVNAPGSDYHGLLVVGWGKLQSCQGAMNYRFTVNDFSEVAPKNNSSSVPYVVDFLGTVANTRPQEPIARPFYCTYLQEINRGPTLNPKNVNTPGAVFFPHNWYFYRLPDAITVSVPKTTSNGNSQTTSQLVRLFVWPTWDWASNSGTPTP